MGYGVFVVVVVVLGEDLLLEVVVVVFSVLVSGLGVEDSLGEGELLWFVWGWVVKVVFGGCYDGYVLEVLVVVFFGDGLVGGYVVVIGVGLEEEVFGGEGVLVGVVGVVLVVNKSVYEGFCFLF